MKELSVSSTKVSKISLEDVNKLFGKGLKFKEVVFDEECTVFVLPLLSGKYVKVHTCGVGSHITCNFKNYLNLNTMFFEDKSEAMKIVIDLLSYYVGTLFSKLQKEVGVGMTRKEYDKRGDNLFSEIHKRGVGASRHVFNKDKLTLHVRYYLQFATKQTIFEILNDLGIDKLRESKDNHLNDVKIPFNRMSQGGSWWWDFVSCNKRLLGTSGSSTNCSATCVSKSTARFLLELDKTKRS